VTGPAGFLLGFGALVSSHPFHMKKNKRRKKKKKKKKSVTPLLFVWVFISSHRSIDCWCTCFVGFSKFNFFVAG
jgi:hypothetical protein